MTHRSPHFWKYVLAYVCIGLGILTVVVAISGWIFEGEKPKAVAAAIAPLIAGAVLMGNLKRKRERERIAASTDGK